MCDAEKEYEKWIREPLYWKRQRRLSPAAGYEAALSKAQKKLRAKHGTPAEFAVACYRNVPRFISMAEADAAVRKYTKEWTVAS